MFSCEVVLLKLTLALQGMLPPSPNIRHHRWFMTLGRCQGLHRLAPNCIVLSDRCMPSCRSRWC